MPTYCIARDPEYYKEANAFDPWRFYDARQTTENEKANQNQLVSTNARNLAWGYGKSACPGRFLAAAQMKLLLAWILTHYDVRFPEGQKKRPENTHVDERIMPDRTQKVGFRLR